VLLTGDGVQGLRAEAFRQGSGGGGGGEEGVLRHYKALTTERTEVTENLISGVFCQGISP
jgi:hypothetical protein